MSPREGRRPHSPGSESCQGEGSLIRSYPSRIVIAVLDTGIGPAERELETRLVPGATFVRGALSTRDDHGHGTAVARVAAAPPRGVRGSVYLPPLIMPVKVANAVGHTDDLEVARGIHWAVDHGARVVNLSLWTKNIPEMRAAVEYARARGAIVVAAAGNGGGPLVYPADYPGVIAVADQDSPDRQPRSPHASRHLVLARSHAVALRGNEATIFAASGYTSLAAPRVSRLAAILIALQPDRGPGAVIAAIERGAVPVAGRPGFSETDGWGAIDAVRSIRLLESIPGSSSVQAAGS